jgi:diamine N-acetyltransferase
MPLSFRICNIVDLNQLIEISKSTYYEAFAGKNTKESMDQYLNDAFNRNQLKSELENKDSTFYFAYFQNDLIGYFKINKGDAQEEKFDENTIELARLYVIKEYRNKKFGEKILTKALELAKQTDAEFIWLGVWDRNPEAQRFYERFGFIKFGQHPFYMGAEKQTDYLMRLFLR